MSNPEEKVLKAYRKDQPVGPGNLPQGNTNANRHAKETPTPSQAAEYEHDLSKSQARGYETKEEAYRIRVFEHRFTDLRN